MSKPIVLFLIQILETIFTLILWLIPTLIWHKLKYKSLKKFWQNIGIKRINFKTLLKDSKYILLAYTFTIFMYAFLSLTGNKMTTEILTMEKSCEPPLMLLIIVFMMAFRSGFGEELFFRGVIAKESIKKLGLVKGNLLQALIFALPHTLTFIQSPNLEQVLLVMNAFIIGLALGHISNKENHNIVYGMIYHGLINIIALPITWYLV